MEYILTVLLILAIFTMAFLIKTIYDKSNVKALQSLLDNYRKSTFVLEQKNNNLEYKLAQSERQNEHLMAMYHNLRNSCIVLPKDKALFYYITLDHIGKDKYTASFSIN
jgi:flagellar biosynthesis protein FliP